MQTAYTGFRINIKESAWSPIENLMLLLLPLDQYQSKVTSPPELLLVCQPRW